MVLESANVPAAFLCDTIDAKSNGAQGQIETNRHMQDVLQSLTYGMGDVRLQAAKEITRLTKTSARRRAYLAAAGAITPLVSMLRSSSMEAKETSLLALLNLAIRNERSKLRIVKAGAIDSLVDLMKFRLSDLRESAAAVILTLSAADANKAVIGASEAIPLLVEMLNSASIQGKIDAVIGLCNLSTRSENVVRILAAGASAPLILLLRDWKKSSKVAEKVMAILELLMSFEDGRCGVVQETDGLLAIVEVLEEGSVEGREHAVGALLTMCESNQCKYREELLQQGVIPGLLELSVQGTPSAQRKARKLLDLLRNSSQSQRARQATPSSAPTVLEDFVHDIAEQVENDEISSETMKMVLSEMIQLSRKQSMHQLAMEDPPSYRLRPALTAKVSSKRINFSYLQVFYPRCLRGWCALLIKYTKY